MADVNLSGLNIDELTELVGKAQGEMGFPRKEKAEGPQERDRAPPRCGRLQAGRHLSGARKRRRERQPAAGRCRSSSRNPQSPDDTWTGIGRSPKWVQAILGERGIDMAAFKSIPMYQVSA